MPSKKKWVVIPAAIIGFAVFFYFFAKPRIDQKGFSGLPLIGYALTGKTEYLVSQKVEKGKTFAQIAESFGIGYDKMLAILDSAKDVYNLEKVVEGKEITAIAEKETGELKKLVYQIDSEEALVVTMSSTTPSAEKIDIPYETKTEEISGEITSSLFETVTGSGGDDRLALAIAEVFAWQVDFAADIRVGDKFKVMYEKRFLNGNYVGPGKILAARFTNDGNEFKGISFKGSDNKEGYYDEEGLSLEKIFLKSPLSYKYISSGFSYNRLNPVTKTPHSHRAIDYAANYGTPAVTVGDGTVTRAGWQGDLGNAVTVRHNETYTTVYGHLSKFAVRTGQRVKQGQIIGYVGSTGQSTGPHLHFELHKNGAYVNPLTIELPPGDPVLESDRPEFQKTLDGFRSFLDN